MKITVDGQQAFATTGGTSFDPARPAIIFLHGGGFDRTTWSLQTRRVGGEGAERWILSSYRVTGTRADGKPIDQTTLETAIVRRSVGDQFRIVHLHWSTNDPAYQAWAQTQRPKPP